METETSGHLGPKAAGGSDWKVTQENPANVLYLNCGWYIQQNSQKHKYNMGQFIIYELYLRFF